MAALSIAATNGAGNHKRCELGRWLWPQMADTNGRPHTLLDLCRPIKGVDLAGAAFLNRFKIELHDAKGIIQPTWSVEFAYLLWSAVLRETSQSTSSGKRHSG